MPRWAWDIRARSSSFRREIAGQTVEYIVRDDATDASTAFTIAQKMISEDHVDAFIGPSILTGIGRGGGAAGPIRRMCRMIAMAPCRIRSGVAKQTFTFNDAQPPVADGRGGVWAMHATTWRGRL